MTMVFLEGTVLLFLAVACAAGFSHLWSWSTGQALAGVWAKQLRNHRRMLATSYLLVLMILAWLDVGTYLHNLPLSAYPATLNAWELKADVNELINVGWLLFLFGIPTWFWMRSLLEDLLAVYCWLLGLVGIPGIRRAEAQSAA